jgi:hypothetical protein
MVALDNRARAFIAGAGQQFIAQRSAKTHRMPAFAAVRRRCDQRAATHRSGYRPYRLGLYARHIRQRHHPARRVACMSDHMRQTHAHAVSSVGALGHRATLGLQQAAIRLRAERTPMATPSIMCNNLPPPKREPAPAASNIPAMDTGGAFMTGRLYAAHAVNSGTLHVLQSHFDRIKIIQ